jgi:hypothetical protein
MNITGAIYGYQAIGHKQLNMSHKKAMRLITHRFF